MEINQNHPKSTTTQTVSGLGNSQRPGEYLRQIRMSQKKELSDIAQELKIPEKQLMALEKDDYNALPEAPFIKGYYRAYAKFLHVDATALIHRFDEIYSNDTGLTSTHVLKDSPIQMMGRLSRSGRQGMNKWLKRLLWLVLLAVLVWAAWAGVSGWLNQKTVTEVLPTDVPNGQAVEILPMNAGAAVTSGDQLQLTFSRPTSVMIVDSTGKTLAQGRHSDSLTLQGQAPFSIRLDDASAIRLTLNQEEIALARFTHANGSADFRLSP